MGNGKEQIVLNGLHNNYVLFPTDPKSILKSNGELCSTFVGHKESNGQPVLIKRFHKYLNNNPEYSTRAEREYEAISACTLQNPELIILDEVKYLVRDFVDGADLREIISGKLRRKVNQQQIISITIQVLKSLKKIHDAGFVHCDLKPNNIILKMNNGLIDFDNPEVEIIDFGLIRKNAEPIANGKGKLPFSMVYSAPEQLLNLWELISPPTDIYAMGVTLWQLLSGKIPWESSNPLMGMQLQLVMPIPHDRRIPNEIYNIIEKACAKARLPKPPRFYKHWELLEFEKIAVANRYKSTEEMIVALENIDSTVFQRKKSVWRMFS